MKQKTSAVISVPEELVHLLDLTNRLSEAVAKPTLTLSEKRSVRRQLPEISRLLVEAHGDVLEWFGGSDVWDGMQYLVQDARKKVYARA